MKRMGREQKPIWKTIRKPVPPPTLIHRKKERRDTENNEMNIPSEKTKPIIALLTDFGESSAYIGVMKGVILKINPKAEIVDLCHKVTPFKVEEAAYLLKASYTYFPPNTCYLFVVDPEVGSDRRGVAVFAHNHIFVGPDNGTLTYLLDEDYKAVTLDNPDYFLPKVSISFQGRDIFAPVAAQISRGISLEKFGEKVDDLIRLENLFPKRKGNRIYGMIVHIDNFGNIITNISQKDISGKVSSITIKGAKIEKMRRYYTESTEGSLIGMWQSTGHLEIAKVLGNAANDISAKIGDSIEVEL
ncbi:SAM-dependent chlorinase/fluorinase [bacterium]|nr:SAM-dependent chlorinase/fluorinase [bacterium]MBU1599201.1 SAM-dependent chlorinase/fluorinase [bacterium]MBU2461303.1 SAM-dependent chlorinase/fluorinase [bacterium]